MRKFSIALFAVVALAVTVSAAPNALAQGEAPAKHVTKLGYLSCHVASGWGFIFGSSRKLQCTYTPAEKGKKIENYSGSITKFGADIGYLRSSVILWTVLSPGTKISRIQGCSSRSRERPRVQRSDSHWRQPVGSRIDDQSRCSRWRREPMPGLTSRQAWR